MLCARRKRLKATTRLQQAAALYMHTSCIIHHALYYADATCALAVQESAERPIATSLVESLYGYDSTSTEALTSATTCSTRTILLLAADRLTLERKRSW
jgi:hypothetical protein